MNAPKTLKNPPLVEAVFSVQGSFPTQVDLKALEDSAAPLRIHYPERKEERSVSFTLDTAPGGIMNASTEDQGINGYRFFSSDGLDITQFKKSGLTYNRLKPYTSWDDVFPKASKCWTVFRDAFPEFVIHRVSQRYLNQISINKGKGATELKDYFTVDLPGPTGIPFQRAGFTGQSVFYDPITQLHAIWTIALQHASNPSQHLVILDIDVYAQGPDVLEKNPQDLWTQMRDLKNSLFFGSLKNQGEGFLE